MNIFLAPDGPLDPGATLARFHLWGDDPANRLDGDVFRRVLRLDGRLIPYEVRWTGGVDDARLEVRAPSVRGERVEAALTGQVRHIFGLDFDLPGFYRIAKGDAGLAPLIEPLYGLRPTLSPTPFEMLVGSITAQQVNLAFAFTCRARLVRRYGERLAIGGAEVWAFPDAAAVARARVRELRAMQYSTRKAEYIRDLSRAITGGRLDVESLLRLDNATVIERLTALRGLGRWTADWFLARCAGRGDVCPAGDLAVRKAFDQLYARGRRMSEDAIRRRARAWGPYQNLAVHYLLAGMRLGGTRPGGGS